jgi:pimeloyl-ACP methyl ester carboxylesterase
MSKLQFLDRGEGKVAFEDLGGKGPLVVCAPGMGIPRTVYRFSAPILSGHGFRVVTMDLRGMGDSSVRWSDYSEVAIGADLLALVRELQTGPAVLVGNSISAGACVWAATESPQSVAALVLVGPFTRQVPVPAWKRWMFRLALARPWGARVWANYQGKRLYPLSAPVDLAAFSQSVKSNLQEPGRLVAFQRMAATDHKAADARLGQVRTPTLVVMGSADPDFPDPKAEATLVAQRVGGSVALLEGVGHYPQAEVPDAFCQEVLRFLDGTVHGA